MQGSTSDDVPHSVECAGDDSGAELKWAIELYIQTSAGNLKACLFA